MSQLAAHRSRQKPQLRRRAFAPARRASSPSAVRTIYQDICMDPSAPANWHGGKLWLTPCNRRICASPPPALLFCHSQCTHRNVIRLQRIRRAQSTPPPGLLPRASSHARWISCTLLRIGERGFSSSTRRSSLARTHGSISCSCATCRGANASCTRQGNRDRLHRRSTSCERFPVSRCVRPILGHRCGDDLNFRSSPASPAPCRPQ